MEVKRVRLNIPDTIDEYLLLRDIGDPDNEIPDVRKKVDHLYETSSPELILSMKRYLSRLLSELKLDNVTDLNNLFGRFLN